MINRIFIGAFPKHECIVTPVIGLVKVIFNLVLSFPYCNLVIRNRCQQARGNQPRTILEVVQRMLEEKQNGVNPCGDVYVAKKIYGVIKSRKDKVLITSYRNLRFFWVLCDIGIP